jgi:hypothetical protein
VLCRDVQFQHWDAAAQATAAAQVAAAEHAAASGVEPDQDAHAEHTSVMPADPVRRKRVGCYRRLESTRINHEIASCFNTGCE